MCNGIEPLLLWMWLGKNVEEESVVYRTALKCVLCQLQFHFASLQYFDRC